MKILAFTDIHASAASFKKLQSKIKRYKPDYLFCLGDFTVFEQNIKAVMEKLNSLGKPLILIHGNHETANMVKRLAAKHKHLTFAHNTLTTLNGYTIVAHGGGGFYGQAKTGLERDKDFDRFVKANKTKLRGTLILLTHAPPAKTRLDKLDWIADHVGCPSYTDFIKTHKPLLALSGHLHENFGIRYKSNKTTIANPGPDGMIFTL